MTKPATPPTNGEASKIDFMKPVKMGDLLQGEVIGTGRSAVFLNLGPQGTGIIYGKEFLDEKSSLKDIKQGGKVTAKVVDLENDKGYIELSLKQAGREMTWDKLREKKEKEEVFQVKIVGANKGGLLAELHGIQAFLPVSQLSQEHYPRVEDGDSSKILHALQEFMGKELEVQIFDLDQREEKVILSERSKERAKVKEQLSKFQVGDIVEGEITGVVDFGAFIKFPMNDSGSAQEPIEGLIHISEIDWQIIENPNQLLKVGERVRAKIVDTSSGRASLSLKALKEDPWKEIEKKYKKLDSVKGKVTKLNPFGAFVEIEDKIQGLCHISEFGTKAKMEEALKPGNIYSFQILELNPAEHRMSLRLVLPGSNTPETAEPQEQKPELGAKQE
ncbi:MAG TPA: S1 RNA-binding domain-containing protein [Candidatus Paceibacterota bacterium]